MPPYRFITNAFNVEVLDGRNYDFLGAIANAESQPFPNRSKNINGRVHRLEMSRRTNYGYLLEFTSLRFDGASRATIDGPVRSMGMTDREEYAHRTAALYDDDTRLMLIQSVQSGAGSGAIAKFFGNYSGNVDYRLSIKLDEAAKDRAQRFNTIRKVVVRASAGRVSRTDVAGGMGLIPIASEALAARAVDIEFKAGRTRDSTLDLGYARRMINELTTDDAAGVVEKVQVYGKEHEDEKLELIDLLQHREKRIRSLEIDNDLRGASRDLRWEALEEIRQDFVE